MIIREYVVASTNTTDNIYQLIKASEAAVNTAMPDSFAIKKIGILAYSDCSIVINDSTITLDANEAFCTDYGEIDITSLFAATAGVRLKIRYAY